MKLSKNQLKKLSKSIHRAFIEDDNPPADELRVPVEAIKPDKRNGGFTALLKYTVNYCGRKTHTVRINFKPTQDLLFAKTDWHYL